MPLVAAAASGVRDLLTGPVRPGRVLGAHRAAVIIGVPDAPGQRVLSLLAPGAAGVPNGVRLGISFDLTGIAVGAEAMISANRVLVGPLDVRITRIWDSSVPMSRFVPVRVRELAEAAAGAEQGVPAAAVAALRNALADPSQREPLIGAVRGLVGLGQGSTPGGDDALAGVLTGLHATGATALVPLIAAGLDRLPLRTTTLSADLLALSVHGHACLEALDVLRMVSGSGADSAYRTAVRRLLSIGHTSGADLATGLAIGLSVGTTRPSPVDGGVTVPAEAEFEGPR